MSRPVAFDEPRTRRLIARARIDAPAIAPLYDSPAEKAVLDALEAGTSARRRAEAGLLLDIDPGELLTDAFGYGWSFVNAAFVYTRRGGNRFNDGRRGAWYAALDIDTSLAEIGYHLGRALADAGETENVTDYVELVAHVAGSMARVADGARCLDPDPEIGYPAGQKLAAEARRRGRDGVVYPSVRRPGGTCVAVLSPAAILSVTRGRSFRLVWSGGGGPVVRKG